jgi:hypothetical protein
MLIPIVEVLTGLVVLWMAVTMCLLGAAFGVRAVGQVPC